MSTDAPLALALDLGSTRLKLGLLGPAGEFELVASRAAPAVRESGLECDFDAQEFDAQVGELLALAAHWRAPLGIACQRSSFVAWDARDGRALTRAISWRDRRAQSWCEHHAQRGQELARRCGLRFSPHYLGPKLAALVEQGALPHAGEDLRVGTLESFVLARRSEHAEHVTDMSMAARTLLLDPQSGAWDAAAAQFFGVRVESLPRVQASVGRAHRLSNGLHVSASLSDQAAAFLAVARAGAGDVLVNLGTGGFVLRECDGFRALDGYLCGPLLDAASGARRWALEGTVNAGAAGLDAIGGASAAPAASDSQPELFCSPESGLGAPHWRAGCSPTWSKPPAALDASARRRAYLEGLVFRVAEIVDALDPACSSSVFLSGGVARDPFIAPALALLLRRPLELLDEHESTLLGAARLAAGLAPFADPPRRRVAPSEASWLAAKRTRWTRWRDAWLAGAPAHS